MAAEATRNYESRGVTTLGNSRRGGAGAGGLLLSANRVSRRRKRLMKSVTHFIKRQLKERKKNCFKSLCVMRLMNSRFVGFLAAEVQPSAWGVLGVVLGVEGRSVEGLGGGRFLNPTPDQTSFIRGPTDSFSWPGTSQERKHGSDQR